MTKILIVDDEKMLRRLLSEDLAKHGYDVIEAENGETAFELFESETPALIISDLMMPLMDGYGLYKKVVEKTPGFPYILITGYPEELNRFDIKTKGNFVVIQKPFEESEIISVITKILQHSPKTP